MADKARYKITNWKDYNQRLIKRGDITLWLNDEVLDHWRAAKREKRRGRPKQYSDIAVECMLTLRALFKLPLRAVEGLMISLLKLLDCAMEVPTYATLSRRQQGLLINLNQTLIDSQEPKHVLVDSTGLKVYGEGEWKLKKHGRDRRRVWRKLHLAVDAKTHEIVAADLTENSTADCEALPTLLLKIEGNVHKVSADGAYDTWNCRYTIHTEVEAEEAIIPPRERARKMENTNMPEVRERNEAINVIQRDGRKSWKEQSGYHQRSLFETAMFRVKRTFGQQLQARTLQNQISEAVMKSKILNQFIQQGMPESEKIEN